MMSLRQCEHSAKGGTQETHRAEPLTRNTFKNPKAKWRTHVDNDKMSRCDGALAET